MTYPRRCLASLLSVTAYQLLATAAATCPLIRGDWFALLANHMQPDEELCLCFHVSRRKVANYIRLEKPRRVAQLSECFGAGTGCGWCRPFLEQLFLAAQADERGSREGSIGDAGGDSGTGAAVGAELPAAADYARERARYVRAGGGTPPPGATPPPLEEYS